MQLTENIYAELWTKLDALERCATAGLIGNARANLVEAGGIVREIKQIMKDGITVGQED